jgi:hypothetical protein
MSEEDQKNHRKARGDALAAEQQNVVPFNFYGDRLDVVRTSDGEHWVVLARLCEHFEVDADGQRRKLLTLPWARTKIILAHDASGREQDLFCINIRSVAGWLFTLNIKKVAEHLREKLIRYQRECADALAEHFLGKRVSWQELDLLQGRMARLEEILAGVYAAPPSLPSIGRGKARMLILDNLMEIARLRAAAFGVTNAKELEQAVKRFDKIADDRLRLALNFPRAKGCEWHRFPAVRLGEAVISVNMLVAEARDELQFATGARHKQLVLLDIGEGQRKRRGAPTAEEHPPDGPDDESGPNGPVH